jgi:hypothetical protein
MSSSCKPQVGASCVFEEGETSRGKVALNVEILAADIVVNDAQKESAKAGA